MESRTKCSSDSQFWEYHTFCLTLYLPSQEQASSHTRLSMFVGKFSAVSLWPYLTHVVGCRSAAAPLLILPIQSDVWSFILFPVFSSNIVGWNIRQSVESMLQTVKIFVFPPLIANLIWLLVFLVFSLIRILCPHQLLDSYPQLFCCILRNLEIFSAQWFEIWHVCLFLYAVFKSFLNQVQYILTCLSLP